MSVVLTTRAKPSIIRYNIYALIHTRRATVMKEVTLEGLSKNTEEATVQTWFFEEGDAINEGDDLVEMTSEDGTLTVSAPISGILAEVYYDEGEIVAKGEVLCIIDDDSADEDDEDEDEDSDEDDDEDEDDEDEDFDDEDEEKDEK